MTTRKTTPIWLLDVDGVLNAFPGANDPDSPLPDAWPDYTTCKASPRRGDHHKYTITYSPTLTAKVKELHESGAVEVRWLTTWGSGANVELADELGLPHFEVAGEPDVLSGFAGAPEHSWWKFDDARRAHDAEPHRAIIWTDDDLRYVRDAQQWCHENGALALAPQQETGITPEQLEAIASFIRIENARVA